MFNSSHKSTHLAVAHPFNGWQLSFPHHSAVAAPAPTAAPAPAAVAAQAVAAPAQAAPVAPAIASMPQYLTKFGVTHVPNANKWTPTLTSSPT